MRTKLQRAWRREEKKMLKNCKKQIRQAFKQARKDRKIWEKYM